VFEFSIEGQPAAKKFQLTQSTAGVGRDPTNALHLDDPRVSRFHACLIATEEGCLPTDLGSANGTRVNGEELEPRVERRLAAGDRLEVGPFVLHCRIVAADTQAPSSQQVVVTTGLAACLRVVTPEGATEHVLVGDELTLGRDPTNDIVVEADTVSRRHASLVRRDGEWEIIDLGSTNGLQSLAGRRVERAVLRDGERLLVGQSVELQFSRGAPSAPPAPSIAPCPSAAGPASPPRPPTREIALPSDVPLVLGRGEQADLVLAHPQVSKNHARITRRGGRYVVEDLRSTSGTYVNGQPVRAHPLREGDELRVGSSRLILRENKLQVLDEAGNLRLDAFHLSREVGKGRVILSDVSLSILPREFVAIVGGSGSGKTTLLNALCGFQPASTGRVLLNGVDLYQSFSAYRNELGYVPQDDIIHRDLPVMRALNYAAALRMPRDTSEFERRQRVQEVLHQLDIHSCWDRPMKQLSGGQRKRVSMGVELLTRPSLFFLDEATSGLDPGTEAQLMRLLRRLADEGRTVVLVTHATKNVMMCDKVVFLARGGHLAYFGTRGGPALLRGGRLRRDIHALGRRATPRLEPAVPLLTPLPGERRSPAFYRSSARDATLAGFALAGLSQDYLPALRSLYPACSCSCPQPPRGIGTAAVPGSQPKTARYHLERQEDSPPVAGPRSSPRRARLSHLAARHVRPPYRKRHSGGDDVLHHGHHQHPDRDHHLSPRDRQRGRHLPARAHGRAAGTALRRLQGGCGLPVRGL